MSNNNFKLDIGGMVRQVEDLNKALEQLGVLAQGVFGTLGRAADVFGGKMSAAGQQQGSAPGTNMPGSMLTQAGSSAASDLDLAIARGVKAEQIMRSGLNQPGSQYVTAPGADPMIMERHQLAHGTQLSSTGIRANNIRQAILDGEQARFQQDIQRRTAESNAAQAAQSPSFVPPQHSPSKAAFGYGAKDIMRLSQQMPATGDISKSLELLANNLRGSNEGVSKAVSMLNTDLNKNMQNFQSALAALNDAQDPEEQIRAMNSLTHVMKSLDKNIEESNDTLKQGGGPGGPGGPGGGGTNWWEMARRFGPGAFAVGTTAVTAALASEVAMRQATAGKQLDLMQAEAGIAQKSFAASMEAHDMTKAENLLKYRGDILSPGRFDYLGTRGLSAAMGAAGSIHDQQLALMRAERGLGVFQSAAGVVGGIGSIIGGLAAGGPLGAIGGLFGLQSILSNTSSGIRDYYTNPLTLSEGGLTGSWLGRSIGSFSGVSMSDMKMAETAAKRRMDLEQFSNARAIQDLEIQRNPSALFGIQEMLNRQQAQKQGALLVGRYAPGMSSADKGFIPDDLATSLGARATALGDAQAESDKLEERVGLIGKDGMKFLQDRAQAGDTAARSFFKTLSRRDRAIKEGFTDAKKMPSYGQARESAWAALGMSSSEFMMSQAQLANYTGAGISADALFGETARIQGYTKGGFGSFEEMLSRLGDINRAAGGAQNDKKLESLLVTAFSNGFDKSRMAQQFVQTSTELAKVIQSQSPEEIGKKLGFASAVFAESGKADERTLQMAASGMQQLAAYTGQTGGVMGALKYLGVYGGGGTIGTGGALVQGSNLEQLNEYERQLTSGKITDDRLNRIVRLAGGDKDKALAMVRGGIAGASTLTRANVALTLGANQGLLSKYGVGSLSQLEQAGQGLTGKAREEFIKDYMALYAEAGMDTEIGEAGGMAAGASRLQSALGFTTKFDKDAFNRASAAGRAKSVTTAERNYRKHVDSLYAAEKMAQGKAVTTEEYLRHVGEGGGSVRFLGDEAITAEMIEKYKGDPEKTQAIEKEIAKMNRFEMAQEAQYNIAGGKGDQRVFVTNLADLKMWLDIGGKNALNSGSGKS